MRVPVWAGLFLGLAFWAGAGALPGVQAGQPIACQVTRVIDGDTLLLGCGRGERRLRLMGYDAPELSRPHCPAEARAARAARDVLAGLVAGGAISRISLQGQDRYGRDLAWLEVAGQDVARAMLASGLALPYAGHRRPDWCAHLAG